MGNDWAIIGQKPHQSCNKGAISPYPLPAGVYRIGGEGGGEGELQIFSIGTYLAILAIIWQIRKGANGAIKKPSGG